jgi:hypothetical protein
MVVSAPQMLASGQVTPNALAPGQMIPCPCALRPLAPMQSVPGLGQTPASCGWQLPTKPVLELNTSVASTAVPSGVCSDAGSEIDEEEDLVSAVSELMKQLEAGGAARDAALEALEGSVQDLSFDPSCRVVQKALECADVEVAASLAFELQGRVREAVKCPHANHVVQKVMDILPAKYTRFIVDELVGTCAEMARHRYGCRVLSRVVKTQFRENDSENCEKLADELLAEAAELSRHTFAHYVIEAILEHGTSDQLHEVSVSLRMDLLSNAKNRSATYVVEKALKCCDAHDQEAMISELFGNVEALLALVGNQFGCHVAKALVRMPGIHYDRALAFLPEATPLLQKTKYGRRVLEEFRQRPSQ